MSSPAARSGTRAAFRRASIRSATAARCSRSCASSRRCWRTPRAGALPNAALHRVLRKHPKDGRGLYSRSELIAGFRAFGAAAGLALDEARFVERVQLRPVRTQSGVTPVTVLSKPFPCPGTCVFCPNDVRMPKSYLSREPGCQRAEQNGFDPYLQTYNRLLAFRAIGHAQDKAELIVLGGTWSFYPEDLPALVHPALPAGDERLRGRARSPRRGRPRRSTTPSYARVSTAASPTSRTTAS